MGILLFFVIVVINMFSFTIASAILSAFLLIVVGLIVLQQKWRKKHPKYTY